MSNLGDKLILGPETGRAHDSDGDGVSDAQEGLDGTDANDPNSLIRRDDPIVRLGDDPRGDLDHGGLGGNIVVDVTANVPGGKSLEQNLPVGLDGRAVPTTHQHYGNADADKMFGGRTDTDSPLNMQRDPLAEVKPTTPGAQTFGGNSGVITTTDGGSTNSFTSSGTTTPPSGADLGYRAPNIGLVGNAKVGGKEINNFKEGSQRPYNTDPKDVPKAELDKFDKEPPSWWEQKQKEWKQMLGSGSDGSNGMDNLGAAGDKKKKMVDPDSGAGDSGTPSAEEIERALVVAGGATDFVEGYGGALPIQGDAVLKRPIDLVTDGGADDATEGTVTKANAPGIEISRPVNPQDDILGGPTPHPGGGQSGGGQGGGGNTGSVGKWDSATAVDASQTSDVGASTPGGTGVVNIGGGQTGGIASVEPNGADTGTADGAGDMADDTAGDVPDSGAPVEMAEDVPDARPLDATPLDETPLGDAPPVPMDPVADAMTIEAEPYAPPVEQFVSDDALLDVSIPDEPDLDDGF